MTHENLKPDWQTLTTAWEIIKHSDGLPPEACAGWSAISDELTALYHSNAEAQPEQKYLAQQLAMLLKAYFDMRMGRMTIEAEEAAKAATYTPA